MSGQFQRPKPGQRVSASAIERSLQSDKQFQRLHTDRGNVETHGQHVAPFPAVVDEPFWAMILTSLATISGIDVQVSIGGNYIYQWIEVQPIAMFQTAAQFIAQNLRQESGWIIKQNGRCSYDITSYDPLDFTEMWLNKLKFDFAYPSNPCGIVPDGAIVRLQRTHTFTGEIIIDGNPVSGESLVTNIYTFEWNDIEILEVTGSGSVLGTSGLTAYPATRKAYYPKEDEIADIPSYDYNNSLVAVKLIDLNP